MMYAALFAVFMLAFAGGAMADGHDRRVDEAAARIVAGRIGDIRGGFGPGQTPDFIEVSDEPVTGAIARAPTVSRGGAVSARWNGGLVRAREPGRYEPFLD